MLDVNIVNVKVINKDGNGKQILVFRKVIVKIINKDSERTRGI